LRDCFDRFAKEIALDFVKNHRLIGLDFMKKSTGVLLHHSYFVINGLRNIMRASLRFAPLETKIHAVK
jgi:hypothetical protein